MIQFLLITVSKITCEFSVNHFLNKLPPSYVLWIGLFGLCYMLNAITSMLNIFAVGIFHHGQTLGVVQKIPLHLQFHRLFCCMFFCRSAMNVKWIKRKQFSNDLYDDMTFILLLLSKKQ